MEEKISVLEKARGEKIYVYVSEYKGTKYLHIREWYKDKEANDEEKPTKKGVTFPMDKIDALREAIEQALANDQAAK